MRARFRIDFIAKSIALYGANVEFVHLRVPTMCCRRRRAEMHHQEPGHDQTEADVRRGGVNLAHSLNTTKSDSRR